MDLIEIVNALKGASPWLVVVGGMLAGLWMLLNHRTKAKDRHDLDELRDIIVAIHDECAENKEMLAAHIAASTEHSGIFREAVNTQTSLLTRMVSELSSMNAIATGRELTLDTAKIIIQTQWEACRDETIRLLLNSIENNHFKDNEKLVARKVYRAWKQAAEKAQQVVAAHPGMSYPYVPLFEMHVSRAWERAWEWSLPIYHRDVGDRADALDDLVSRVKALFSEILKSYYGVVEDIDRGTLYSASLVTGDGSSGSRHASECTLAVNDAQSEVVETMLIRLRDYKHRESSGAHRITEKTIKEEVVAGYEKSPLSHTPPPPERERRRKSKDA